METEKKRLKKEYRQARREMGVFVIRNMLNDRIFVGVGADLAGIINRHKFELKMGSHRNKRLQDEWNEFGGSNFAFEILDQLHPGEDPQADYRKELAFLEELWVEKLQPFGERGYNKRKLSREEMLRRIASKRSVEA